MLSDPDLQLQTQEGEEGEVDEVQLLFQVWLNERMSPSLLYHREEIISTILALLENQVKRKKSFKSSLIID